MDYYIYVHFNDISESRKLRSLLNFKKSKWYTPCRLRLPQIPSVTVRSDEIISVEYRHTNFNSYIHIFGPPTKLFCHYAFSFLGTPDTQFARHWVMYIHSPVALRTSKNLAMWVLAIEMGK